MLHYILQTILFQLLFLLMYEFLLKKETFFTYNRWYLLITPVLSLVLPLLKFQTLGEMVPVENWVLLPEVVLGDSASNATAEAGADATAEEATQQINWWWIAYFTGLVLSLILFIRKYRILRALFNNKLIEKREGLRIIEIPNSNLACTFFNTIFLGDRLSKKEVQQILSHELVHVKQRHTADLLFFEFLKIIFWFDPLVYIYQSRISTLHEFIADAGVVETVEKKTYYQQLLNTAFSTENISFINQFFNHSLIKKRIVMLQKTRSKAISKFKYLFLVPLMLAMLTYVACSKETFDDTMVKDSNVHPLNEVVISSNEGNSVGDVPFSIIDEVPVFPGCEDLESSEERKACTSQGIANFVNNNFDVDAAKKFARPGINRIYVQFRITKEGSVEEMGIRASSPELEEEARKLISLMPQMTPGKHEGEEAGVLYSLPISFKNGEAENAPTATTTTTRTEVQETGNVPFAVIEEVPVFPGCEDLTTNEERKACMAEKVTQFINQNFNTGLGKEHGLTGISRIYVQFKITKDGNVELMGARAPHPSLEEEAARVVNSLPQMAPGKQKGQEVGVLYTIPITLNVSE